MPRSWTFVIEHGNEFSIVTYSGKKVLVSNSPGTLKQSEILTNKIIMPRELFERNRAVIFNTTRTGYCRYPGSFYWRWEIYPLPYPAVVRHGS